MRDIQIIENPQIAAVAIDPIRSRLLSELSEPASAAALSEKVGITRQKVNYHLRALETNGLVHVAEERKWGGLTERLMIASAAGYVLSPAVMGTASVDPENQKDKLSASFMIALAARVIREVGTLIKGALDAKKYLATLSIETSIRFRSAQDRAEFTTELVALTNQLAAKYHHENAIDGRTHRLIIMAHPQPNPNQ